MSVDNEGANKEGAYDDFDFGDATTQARVSIYESANDIFEGLLDEVKELSRKKPEATMSANKVKIINRVLTDLLSILKQEPTGKYLDLLDDELLPQISDAVLVMVQFQSALEAYKGRYHRYLYPQGGHCWVTEELVEEIKARPAADDEEEDELR
ncbi:MAG TPA: hypothetical protein VHD59_03500 [Pseudolabrys sp.]|nr:hypothetical protein [Pseudolabrys sp.]